MRTGLQFWVKVAIVGLAMATLFPSYCLATDSPASAALAGVSSPSGCHDSAPSAPQAPLHQKKCCFAGRTPHSAVSGRYVVPQPCALEITETSTIVAAKPMLEAMAPPPIAATGPPGLQVLRI
jgi:hypothetical protein